ncbi:glycosyltransferase family 4 protein (plasmid) [Novosphingobium sp. BL-8A]|uniref:glycosyltransferase family 4 protein n=1 Tax=Novosphingobium sp. BL-8A TaxID=3127639 RepID=UPI003756AC81
MSQLPKDMDCSPSDRRLRIAFVYSRLPFPMMRGDQLTVAHLIAFLAARGHSIDLYTLDMQGELSRVQRDWLAGTCRTLRIYRQGLGRILAGLTSGLCKGEPAQVAMFRNGALQRDLAAAIDADEYDLVYSYYIRSAHAVPSRLAHDSENRRPGSPVSFLAMQLSQSLNSRRIFENERNPLRRLFYRLETTLCERFEARVWQRFSRSVLIGPADVAKVRDVCKAQGQPEINNWVYGAHGTDLSRYQAATPEETVPGRVVFSGSMLYQPNVQAALWFVEQCWPRVRATVPEAELVIQGRDPVAEIRELDGKDGICVTGTVEDVGVYIRSASVCINPMLAAGGMQNKLIEYMACGKAIVATSVANEGIMAPTDTFCLADDAASFADGIVGLLSSAELRDSLGKTARRYVEDNWTWESHFLKLEEAFFETIDAASGGRLPDTGVPDTGSRSEAVPA